MSLFENPIFLTQRRLVHRAGVLAAVLVAALIGLSLLAGLIYHQATPGAFHFSSSQAAGKLFYGWVLAMEMLVLVIGGFSRISRTLVEERKAGLWDSNRLTPLQPAQLVAGYWFGAALREFYMGAVLAVVGLAIVVAAKLPLTLWLGTQALTLASALLFGLLGVLVGLAAERSQSGLVLLLLVPPLLGWSNFQSGFLITSFLLPIQATVDLFSAGVRPMWREHVDPELFGLPAPAIVLSFGLQFIVGWFLWRAAVRKTANPFQSLFHRGESVGLFAVLMAAQHGLIWGIWSGKFGVTLARSSQEQLLSIVHAAALLCGVIILMFTHPQLEHVRVEALRSGRKDTGWIWSRSSVMTALALAGVAAAGLLTHFAVLPGSAGTALWQAYFVAAGNLLALFVMFALLFEICRLWFRRRAISFFGLGLFVLCILPFVLAGVFANPELCRLSFLAPGVIALGEPESGEPGSLIFVTGEHLLVVAALFILWRMCWKSYLENTAPPASPMLSSTPATGE